MTDPLHDPRMGPVLARLEARDASERERDVARSVRLRQVSPEVGRFLHVLVLATGARNLLEIGTSGGYSTTWLASAARANGGRMRSLEIDPVKVRLARETITDAGLADTVEIVEQDAFAWLAQRQEALDFIFLDAEKEDYDRFLDLVVPRLTPGGLLVADNLLSHADDLASFRDRALAHPLLTGLVVPIGRGELVAAKAR